MVSILQKIKYRVRKTWNFINDLFDYPNWGGVINSNYDKYWQMKRFEDLGKLNLMQKKRADYIISRIAEYKDVKPTIVDVGCGDGAILNYLSKKITFGKKIGIDVSSFALNTASGFGIFVLKQNLNEEIPSADYILLLEVLEHVPDSESLLKRAMLSSGRGVFFSVPNTGFIKHRLRMLLGRFPLQWKINPNEHLRFWTLSDLDWWLKAMNINKKQINPYHGIPFLNKIWPSLFAEGVIVFIPKN